MDTRRTRKLAKYSLWLAGLAVAVIVLTNVGPFKSYADRLFPSMQTFPHYIQTVVPEATGVIPGERMVAAGITVGSIESANVTRSGEAHIVMGIDDSAWPLASDTVLTLRMGGTIKYTDRFINVARGHARTDFADGAYIPARQFVAPVEYDTLFDAFTPSTRAGLQSFLGNAGPALTQAEKPLQEALNDSPTAVGQAAQVFSDIGYDQQALSTLVDSTDDVVNAIARSTPGVQQLLQGAANTFTAVSSQSHNLQTALSDAPAALQAAGHVTFHATETLDHVATLSDRLNPGITQLRELATPLDGALRTVVNVAPDAIDTFDTIRQAAPSLDALLAKSRTVLMPRLESIGRQAAKQLGCVRPYTPEAFSLLGSWAGFLGDGNAKDDVMRGNFGPTLMTNFNTVNSAQYGKLEPLQINYPQVPGGIVNQPWYQPQCDITANDFKLADDPEANTFDPLGAKDIPYPSSPS